MFTLEDLKQKKDNYIQKQKNFYFASMVQDECVNRLNTFTILTEKNSENQKNAMTTLYNALDQRYILALNRLKQANEYLKDISSQSELSLYIRMFNIDYIDKDLLSLQQNSVKFYNIFKKNNSVSKDSLENFEQTSLILKKLYNESIKQLQYCINFIEKEIKKQELESAK